MRQIFSLLIIVCGYTAGAQNYQCLQAGVKHYFINTDGYLRGIRIDSVRTYADSVVYYPFHTPRGEYGPGHLYGTDTMHKGSWLGEKVLQLNDGTFIFDNIWDDSVIIKTQASVGDSWIFYNDTGHVYYEASLTTIDTMTVYGALDSVKTIMITARNSAGIVTTDPVDSFELRLSKNGGFVQAMDLYTFPYHKGDSAYRRGLDVFLDIVTGNNPPALRNTIFSITDLVVPNEQQLHNWSIGDVLESNHGTPVGISPIPAFRYDYILDTVTSKVVSGHNIIYTLSGTHYTCTGPTPCALVNNAGVYSFADNVYPIFDTSFIPENITGAITKIYYYGPDDTSYCLRSPIYRSVRYNFPYSLDYTNETIHYKVGIGEINYFYGNDELEYETDGLIYYRLHGVECGTFYPMPVVDNGVGKITGEPLKVLLYPNPTSNELTVQVSTTGEYSLTMANAVGQVVRAKNRVTGDQLVSVVDLPNGVYSVSVDCNGVRLHEQITVIH